MGLLPQHIHPGRSPRGAGRVPPPHSGAPGCQVASLAEALDGCVELSPHQSEPLHPVSLPVSKASWELGLHLGLLPDIRDGLGSKPLSDPLQEQEASGSAPRRVGCSTSGGLCPITQQVLVTY